MKIKILQKIKLFNKDYLLIILSLLTFSISFSIFIFFIQNELPDVIQHFNFCHVDKLPSNFLLYIIPSFFSNIFISKIVFTSIVSFAILLKFFVINYILKNQLKEIHQNYLLVISFLLLFIFSLPSLAIFSNQFYLKTFAVNVWHNSTIILVMPFTLLLYYFIFYKNYSINNTIIIYILILLNLFIKPSFLFILVPLLSIIILINILEKKKLFNSINVYYLLLILFILTVIFIQYLLIYKNGNTRIEEKNEVVFGLILLKWDVIHIINLFFALFTSYLFSIIYLYFTKNKFGKVGYILYLSVLIAILIYLLISEKGSRENHGNFSWQIICSTFILYLFNLIEYIRNYNQFNKNKKIILNLILISNLIYGIIYILRIFIKNEIW